MGRARRTAESERDELAEELSSSGSKGALAIDEKRRLDARIAALEGELEEEQTQSEMLMERARKAQISIEQLTTELASERGNAQKMENSKMMLERQNKELKAKLEEVENSNRAKAKAAIAALESKVANLEEQLSAEAQERMLAAKGNRKLEKKIKELLMQLEDERRHADQYKEQNEKTNGRMKAMRRQLDEAEEEISREKAHRRKAQRELDDYVESNESMNREINNLKNKLRNGGNVSSSRASRRADLGYLRASSRTDENQLGGMSTPLALSSEDLSTRSASPRYNSTFLDEGSK